MFEMINKLFFFEKALVRFKRKFKEDQESIEGIESKNNDLKEVSFAS